jgi:hypothetical protein
MNMMSPGHRVPETLLNVSLRFVCFQKEMEETDTALSFL